MKKISNRKCVPSNWPGQCSTCRNACMPTTSPGVCADVHLLLQPGCLLPGVPAGALPPFPHAGSCASPAKETFLWRAPWPQHPTAGEVEGEPAPPCRPRALTELLCAAEVGGGRRGHACRSHGEEARLPHRICRRVRSRG